MGSKYRSRGTKTDMMWVVDAIFSETPDVTTLSVLNRRRAEQGMTPIKVKLLNQATVNLQTDDPFTYPYRFMLLAKNKATTGYYTPQSLVTDNPMGNYDIINFVGGTEFNEEIPKFGKALENLPEGYVLLGDIFSVEYLNKSALQKIAPKTPADNKYNSMFRFYVAGSSSREYLRNIRSRVNVFDVYSNLENLLDLGVNFYIIFTGMSVKEIRNFKMNLIQTFGEEKAKRMMQDAISLEVDISEVDSGVSVQK